MYLAYTVFVLLSGLFLLLLYILFVLEKQVEAVANVNETRQNYHKRTQTPVNMGLFSMLLDILKQGGHKRNAVNTGFLYAYGG